MRMRTLKTKAKMANGNVKSFVLCVRFSFRFFLFFYILCSNREGEKVIQFYAHFSSGWRWPRSVLRMLKDRRQRRKGERRTGDEFVRNECACSWLVGDALRSVALRCDALLVKITSAQGIRFSGPSLSWPQGQQERREEECVMETNETKQNKTKWNEMQSVFIFLS